MSEIQKEKLTSHQKAALNYKKHISLTANAGSGKTFVLSKRYVEIALNENLPLRNLVAITFTDKAAGELYKKITKEIDDKLNETQDLPTINRLERIRKELVSANISTIHSFCHDILKEFSTEAEIDANFQFVDKLMIDELIDVSLEEYFDSILKSDNSEDLKYLIRVVGSLKRTKEKLKSLLGSRKNILHTIEKLYSREEGAIADFYDKLFLEKLESLFKEKINSIIDDINKINELAISTNINCEKGVEISRLLTEIEKEKDILKRFSFIKIIEKNILTPSNHTVCKNDYLKTKEQAPVIDEISRVEDFFEEIRSIEINEDIKEINKELAKFSKVCATIFSDINLLVEEKKRTNGFIDYEDMLILAEKIISIEDVKNYLSSKYNYIMIDEYQDTNEIQYNIFIPLLDNFKKNNLFVVGDEKQSIYRFRDAELEIFNTTKSKLKGLEAQAEILSLPHSFRMSPPIAGFVNFVFSQIFKEANPEFNEVEYSELICTKSEDDFGEIQFLMSKENSQSESELTALKILDLINNKKCDFKDVAILCRKRIYFSELEDTFTKNRIPYSILGGRGFFQQQFVYDIYNYISFLLNNNDDIALVGILRAPFYFLSDSEIAFISSSSGNSFYDKINKIANNNNRYKKVVKLLEHHIILARTTELNFLVRKILTDTGYLGVVSATNKSRQDLVNIDKLINISNEFSKKSFKSPYDFQIFLKGLITKYEEEGQADVNEDLNTVNIMTIHQAKGLEFKVVFLYKSNSLPQKEAFKKSEITFNKEFGFLSKVPLNARFTDKFVLPPIAFISNYIENKKSIAEEKRLLYVALTRAIEYLFITAKIDKNRKIETDSFLKSLNDTLNLNFGESEQVIYTKLDFMELNAKEEKIYSNDMTIPIKMVYQIEDRIIDIIEETEENAKSFLIDECNDTIKNEIISATKISIYSQCPVRYQLIYEIGYSAIFSIVKKFYNDYEFKSNEDEEIHQYSDVKGLVIHYILEKNIDFENLNEKVNSQLKSRLKYAQISEKDFSKLRDDIVNLLMSFSNSGTFRELKKNEKFKNEFEVYIKKNDFYLYGIIDKLIYNDDKIIVVDYKTDDIKQNEIEERVSKYLTQLTFYCYLISCLYPKISKFEIRIIFIHYPEQVFTKEIYQSDLLQFEANIIKIVGEIRKGIFVPNYEFCKNCYFYFENKCVKERNKL
ncbi:MAG: UvrD-helicase domain-containing protein [Ignavibacteriales bacterium]|nr:UvrD-helicase domain-containing protein [Ignavibacteriales bacterium]